MNKLNKKSNKRGMGIGVFGWFLVGAFFLVLAVIVLPWIAELTKTLIGIPVDYEDKVAISQKDQQQLISIGQQASYYYSQGQYDAAASKYKELVEKDPGKLVVYTSYFEIAKSFYESGKKNNDEYMIGQAMIHYKLYIETMKNEPIDRVRVAYNDLIEIYVKKNMKTEAEALASKYKQSYPQDNYYAQLQSKIAVA
jgi:tetratricopeptide (TPR) repeat protein